MFDATSADMSPEARTERLCWFLRNTGHIVEPEMKDGHWCALRVVLNSAAQAAQESSEAGVHTPVEGTQIGMGIGAPTRHGKNVIDLPPVG